MAMLEDPPAPAPTTPQAGAPRPSRRAMLAAAGGVAFVVGFHVPRRGGSQAAESGEFAPNAFIRIDRQGDVTLIMPQVEMGQGTYTSIPMILAEELDAAWGSVKLEHAPPNEKLYANPLLGMQATGNSNSIRAFWTPLRKAGAGARAVLVEAAAKGWGFRPLIAGPPTARSSTRPAAARSPMAISSPAPARSRSRPTHR